MRIRMNARVAGDILADSYDRAPLREFRAELRIFRQTLTKPVEPFRDLFSRMEREVVEPTVYLDAWQHAFLLKDFRNGNVARTFLFYGLVVENDAAHVLLEAGRFEHHRAIGAARFFRARDTHGIESFLTSTGAFVGGDYPFTVCHHCFCSLFQYVDIHNRLLTC